MNYGWRFMTLYRKQESRLSPWKRRNAKRVFSMTSAFSWQNSISLCPASFCTPIYIMCASVLNHFSCIRLFATPWTVVYQAPLSTRFSRQEYWSGLLCPPAGDLPDPVIKHQVACEFLVDSCVSSSLTRDQTWAPCIGSSES